MNNTTERLVIEGAVEVIEGRTSAENVEIAGLPIMDILSNIFPSRTQQKHGRWRITLERLDWKGGYAK